MNKLEKVLANKFSKKYCCFTGSGTTAIFLILKALKLQNKKILYPAITCMTPVNAAIYAGYKPIFCDVNLNDYTMDVSSLQNIIRNEDIGIIVPTHIYGHRCNMKVINKIAKENGIFVLEDAAQSYYFDDSDASIISFGHTKIFQCKDGGGAIFTDNKVLYNSILEYKQSLLKKPENIDCLFDMYREDYYKIIKNYTGENINKNMFKLQMNNERTFIYDLLKNDNINNVLDKFEKIVKQRQVRRSLYDMYLNKKNIKLPLIEQNEGLWRYTFLYMGNRKKLLEEVRKNNIDISNWYMNLSKIYDNNSNKLNNAEYIEQHVLNLWIDPKYSEEKIKEDIFKINKLL